MVEKLEVYDEDSKLIGVQDREEFYKEIKKEFKKTGKISKKVKSVRILLLNSEGRIYLQKRSKIKSENPGLYDKTIGGHVAAGDSYDMTVVRECAEELGFPASVLSTEDFKKAIKVTNLEIVGIFRKIEYLSNFKSIRIKSNGEEFIQPYMNTMYIGYYDGPIRFVDGESSGIEVFSLKEIEQEIKENPKKFTNDIIFMMNKFTKFLVPRNKLK